MVISLGDCAFNYLAKINRTMEIAVEEIDSERRMVYLRQETQSEFVSANWRSMIAKELSSPAGRCFRPQGDGCVAFWTVLTVSIRSAVCTVNPVNTVTKKPPLPGGVQVHDRSKNRGLSPVLLLQKSTIITRQSSIHRLRCARS
jgi:hypothetical protein